MKAIIKTISPTGYAVDFESPDGELAQLLPTLAKIEAQLADAGYQPNAERHYPRAADGTPICPKHGELMRAREKQGDTWYSHRITGPDGTEHFCRGHAGKSSPGWEY